MERDYAAMKERFAYNQPRSTQQEKSVPKFLKKVFYILEENKHNEYVSWSHDGAAIVIKKPIEFAEKVLPCYFKHNNFASFVRQLNMYNFKKKKTYQYDHAYGHDSFQSGKIELLRNIHRKAAESQMLPQKFAEEAEPFMQKQDNSNEVDIDYLLQENLEYKRVQKALITQLQFVEKKVKDIKTEVNTLQQESQQQGAKEDFLKKVIKKLSECYGSASIRSAIEAVTEDMSPVAKNQQPVYQEQREETFMNRMRGDAEMKAFHPYHEVSSNNYGLHHQQSTGMYGNTTFAKESSEVCEKIEWNDQEEVFGSQETDDRMDMNWHAEFEKKIRNADSFLDGNDRDIRGLDLDITPRSGRFLLPEGVF